ncbi:hypothetical protein PRIPAC_82736 [Pristionchus pacificus]|uniref:Uncharacterized protein n=1 Tax=Pristionchus pacificus TaxID=54126 RepID=A0A2A6CKP1_PRIPA|nr:hypothetical protein PRIPAC_82736 [Pristionchus pacificus]|eukprot:PDM78647.1 hypothetical protein PRIPAC_31226 [Pristionchus pacificus]
MSAIQILLPVLIARLSLVDASCFVPETDLIPRLVLDKPVALTVDDCETACLANSACLGISFDSTCSLLGDPLSGTCGMPTTVRIKKYSNSK